MKGILSLYFAGKTRILPIGNRACFSEKSCSGSSIRWQQDGNQLHGHSSPPAITKVLSLNIFWYLLLRKKKSVSTNIPVHKPLPWSIPGMWGPGAWQQSSDVCCRAETAQKCDLGESLLGQERERLAGRNSREKQVCSQGQGWQKRKRRETEGRSSYEGSNFSLGPVWWH